MNRTVVKVISQTFRFEPAELRVVSKKEIPSEHEEQRAFVSWWRKSTDLRIFAIPNGGGRSKAEGARLKNEGVSAGVPDLFVPSLTLWIEFKKRKGGSVSTEQKAWHKYLEGCGYTVIIPKGAPEGVRLVKDFIERNSFDSS